MYFKTGIGFDSHRFSGNRKLILGGIEIPFEKGLLAYSDGDVLCHAIIDAIIGALGEGDIGKHFPDTDIRFKDISSLILLEQIIKLAKSKGVEILNIDSIIITEKPQIAKYTDLMKEKISLIGIEKSKINIKAKTNEGMGFIGRNEGIVAQAVCLIKVLDK